MERYDSVPLLRVIPGMRYVVAFSRLMSTQNMPNRAAEDITVAPLYK